MAHYEHSGKRSRSLRGTERASGYVETLLITQNKRNQSGREQILSPTSRINQRAHRSSQHQEGTMFDIRSYYGHQPSFRTSGTYESPLVFRLIHKHRILSQSNRSIRGQLTVRSNL
ncbi:hypothetical protein ACOME3_009124 [Neoechinorhynchus agilis]